MGCFWAGLRCGLAWLGFDLGLVCLGFLEFGFLGLGLVLGFWFKGLAEIFMAKRTAF